MDPYQFFKENMPELKFKYKDANGEIRVCRVLPIRVEFGKDSRLSAPTWLLWAFDLDQNIEQAFVISKISAAED